MTFQDLTYFKTVCDQKSITRAAGCLYLSQQGLSRIIKNMEKELGTTLLVRKTSGIELTPSGQYLYEQLPPLLRSWSSICNEITCMEQSASHEIELLSAYGILRLVTPECLEDFRKKYPHIRLTYHEYPDREVERKWTEGRGTVAFLVGNNDVHFPGATQLERFPIKLLVNKAHPLAARKSVTIQDLRGQRLYIESREFHINELIVGRCREAGFEPDIAFETSGFSLCHKMVRQGKGISVTVDFIFEDMTDPDLVMIPFVPDTLYWITYMQTREGTIPNEDLILFRDHVLRWLAAIRSNEYQR